ncbi:MAG: hypothetical protein Q7S16_05545 [bacterium]|nr:hypothetical protein [bacterium]
MKNVIRVCDINEEILQGPYSLKLARAVTGQYMNNGAMYTGIHVAPNDLRDFFLTAIVDETSPDQNDCEQKLMVQGGTQYGCSAHFCPFCVFSCLKYYRNLALEEIIDLFRLALFLHGIAHTHKKDNRELILKFTDNGEPLETPILPEVLDRLLTLFGCNDKILRLKISTTFKNTKTTRQTFQNVKTWQEQHQDRASIHLQISRPPYERNIMPAEEVGEMIETWIHANPKDTVCIAPGLVGGYDHEEFVAFCSALTPMTKHCFFRLSIIKPSTKEQAEKILPKNEIKKVETALRDMGFTVSPLPQNSIYTRQLEGAGTLSHMPNGKFYDPTTYRVWEYASKVVDPNNPMP